MTLLAGTKLGGYTIDGLIGRGSMGEVYRARDSRLDRLVALKVVSPELASNTEQFARFDREARTGALLNHPNIATVYDVGSYDGRPFVVTELLHGITLRVQMGGSPLGAEVAVGYGRHIASGLAAAHQMDVVHRDLRPENIFVANDGRVKILDFGMARCLRPVDLLPGGGSESSRPRVPLGSVGYISPEQVCGQPADQRSDIFSLGVILFEMVSGALPFQRGSVVDTLKALLNDEPPAIGSAHGVGAYLDRTIRNCLAKDPEDRFQSVRDLAFSLELVDLAPRRAARTPRPWLPPPSTIHLY